MRLLHRIRVATAKDLTLGTLFERLAAVHGDRTLVTEAPAEPGEAEVVWTYRSAADAVARWAGAVATLAEPGDRVVLTTGNTYEMLLLCSAVSRAGALPVPVNPQMRPEEVAHVVADCGATCSIEAARDLPEARPLRTALDVEPTDVAALFYTSGTTGKPKGVELTHRALVGATSRAALAPAEVVANEAVVALPLAHIMGFAVAVGFAIAGLRTYFLPRFMAADVLDVIEGRKASVFVGVPAMYRMLLEAGAEDRDLRSIRVWGSGADAMPPELAQRFKDLGATISLPLVGNRGQAAFVSGYGMVELGGAAAIKASPPLLNVGMGAGMGLPLPGYRFKVVADGGAEASVGDTGELWIQGPGVTKGYWGDDAATAEALAADGWLRTGDLVRKGPAGLFSFAGRMKDVIKHGGFSVYAREVEAALEEHPEVLEAAVLGIPDPRKGEVPVAAVRLVADGPLAAADPVAAGDQLQAWAAEQLADYKRPRQVVVLDDLPRTGTNKVQKRRLAEHFTPR